MEKRILIFVILLLIPMASVFGFNSKLDSLPGFHYMYKGEPFPYDSGIAISETKYREIVKKHQLVVIENRIQAALPEIRERVVYIEVPPPVVRDRNRKRNIAFGIGFIVGGIVVEGVRLLIIK